ncbi:acetolactate synthase-1/2/3 large subunit [Tamaricihabitans halophyticus]|uniref:Acetolactate synthase-1/2/3 large subunit n=1 Tax=Tamaricihabitans halophyticus TaxID=1262583 RepID=A0A4R2Q4P2_9PSEU|nr:thiamine pyrophosphate-dependent enzyme [Tamaricihabitans halophyticus]TCP43439.1 acetolactate synthase-1/2/3 large subunit [Tamaricihabitans halophyticus]
MSDDMIPAADAVADLLVEAGVRRAYTVPGESFLPLLEAFERHPELRLISTRHESGAAFMAEADGKLTGVPAVVMATRGVGAANLTIGLHTARQDSTPMLALLGQVETTYLGNEGFQEVDLPSFLGEITTFAATVQRSDRVAQTVARALARASTGRRGPAAVALPSDVLDGSCAPQAPLLGARASAAEHADVLEIARRLAAAKQPVVIAGQGSSPTEVTALARAFGLGVYAAFRRQDCFPNDDEHYLGHLTLGAPPESLASLAEADLVLVLGERLDETTTQGYTMPAAGSTVVHVHPDPAVLGVHQRAELAVAADPGVLCAQLLAVADQVEVAEKDAWWRWGHETYRRIAEASAAPGETGLHPGMVIDAVQHAAEPGTVVVNDAGNFSVYLHRQWVFREQGTQAAPISGAMGYAVPGAIGAALARPDRPVLGVAGDGGFLMTAVELETAVRIGAPVKLLVLQNGLYGTIAMHQAMAGNQVSGCGIDPVDIAGLARSLGAHGIEVDDAAGLPDAARELWAHEGPAVLVARTDSDVIAPGKSLRAIAAARR